MNPTGWTRPPGSIDLTVHEVHVWQAWLHRPAKQMSELERTLSQDEIERAQRFYFERDRSGYVVARGILRALLARYTNCDPAQVQFAYGMHGKPELAWPTPADPIHFNIAHSRHLALYAFAIGRPLGIDVEFMRPLSDMAKLAQRFFSSSEHLTWASLPPQQRVQAYFDCWTRKEAFIKAIGDGLSFPLDRFAVSLVPGEPAELLTIDGDPERAKKWTMTALNPAEGYAAALVVAGSRLQLRSWIYE